MLNLGAQAHTYGIAAVLAEVGTSSAAISGTQAAEIALLGANLPAEGKPSRLLHRLREDDLGTHAFSLSFFKQDVAELLNAGSAVFGVNGRRERLALGLEPRNHLIHRCLR